MAKWTNCENNSFGFETIVQAITYDANGIRGVGVHIVPSSSLSEVIECSAQDSWLELFRQALVLEQNGNVSIAVAIIDSGFNKLGNVPDGFEEITKSMFAKDNSGQVVLVLYKTNGN